MQNAYQLVTDRIISQLEKGVIPWKRDWRTMSMGTCYNRISKKRYSLLNQLMLTRPGEYASFKQWTDAGGKIKKGAKAEYVVFWKMLEVEETDETTKVVTKKKIPMLKYSAVFSVEDVEGVEPLIKYQKPKAYKHKSIKAAEKVRREYIAREQSASPDFDIIFGGNEAFYSPSKDYIQLPDKNQFEHVESFYSTMFHEMVHSTGHISRLARFVGNDKNAAFGSASYSKEELVAEIGASFITNKLGIDTNFVFNNSASYIDNWLSVLKHDNKFIVSAAGKAEKAVNYILGITETETVDV